MFVVTAAFPLTSDQPPLAVADPAAVIPAPADRPAGRADPLAPAGSETADPWKLDPTRDPLALVGPRPAFEANILDAERNLQARLARMELARSHNELLRSAAPTPAARGEGGPDASAILPAAGGPPPNSPPSQP